MNKKILLLTLVSFAGISLKAALPGIEPELANFVAEIADQLNQANSRATAAESQSELFRQQAEEATARFAQLASESKRNLENQEALLVAAVNQETELRDATERAERQAIVITQLRKANIAAITKADEFFRRLQLLTDEHETVTSAHGNAKNALEKIALEKQKSDDEVQRLRDQVASLPDIGFSFRGASMSLSQGSSQFDHIDVLNPVPFKQKQNKRMELHRELQEAVVAQKRLQDSVDEALALVQEKDKKIEMLTAHAGRLQEERIVLEKQRAELENFKDASEDGFHYLGTDDATLAIEGAAAAVLQDEMPRVVRRDQLTSLLEKLKRIARAALDEATN